MNTGEWNLTTGNVYKGSYRATCYCGLILSITQSKIMLCNILLLTGSYQQDICTWNKWTRNNASEECKGAQNALGENKYSKLEYIFCSCLNCSYMPATF